MRSRCRGGRATALLFRCRWDLQSARAASSFSAETPYQPHDRRPAGRSGLGVGQRVGRTDDLAGVGQPKGQRCTRFDHGGVGDHFCAGVGPLAPLGANGLEPGVALRLRSVLASVSLKFPRYCSVKRIQNSRRSVVARGRAWAQQHPSTAIRSIEQQAYRIVPLLGEHAANSSRPLQWRLLRRSNDHA